MPPPAGKPGPRLSSNGYSQSATRLYAQQDHNFNVTSLTDAAGGVVQRFVYDPYGKQAVLAANWSSTTDAYAWVYLHQGGRFNAVTGLYSFRFREYSADWGRWMSADPAGYVDGASLYQALVSTPVNWVDPLGLMSKESAGGIIGGGIGAILGGLGGNAIFPGVGGIIGAGLGTIGGGLIGADIGSELDNTPPPRPVIVNNEDEDGLPQYIPDRDPNAPHVSVIKHDPHAGGVWGGLRSP
ncbi:MAG TPA: RHS repeat-associated core domain-containing protein [Tepidisphaeraceae bacterium]|nr:RHS repeat-associated core domain-containing protein [Tepidisphaeraceae bacterium]